jgi:hypothetical protein
MKSKSAPVTYDASMNVVATKPLAAAVAAAAAANLCLLNSYIRGAVLAKLRADGFGPKEAA